jgi:hypothetical protein
MNFEDKMEFEKEKIEKDIFIRELLSLAVDEYNRLQERPLAHPDDSLIAAFNLLEVYVENRI